MTRDMARALLASATRLIETARDILDPRPGQGSDADYLTVLSLTRQARLAVEKVEKAARAADGERPPRDRTAALR